MAEVSGKLIGSLIHLVSQIRYPQHRGTIGIGILKQ